MKKERKVECPHCGHEFHTRSKLVKVTCPSCGRKIPVKMKKEMQKLIKKKGKNKEYSKKKGKIS